MADVYSPIDKENVYDFILNEENSFRTNKIPIGDNWEWSLAEHIRKSVFYKYGRLTTGNSDDKPVKNIVWPILNVAYRSEGFDVKDIEPFVDNEDNYYKSLLVRKFHPKWARKNDLDTFIDELVEASVDFDLALVKNVNDVRPEVVPLQRLAFCDQTDILAGAICEKHLYAPDQLSDMVKQGWNKNAIDQAITMSRQVKTGTQTNGKEAKTPGKYIEVYELHGVFPETWLDENGDPNKYTRQFHVITYYKNKDNEKQGITLYQGKEAKSLYKALVITKIFGRAAGYGGVEALFEPQVWTTYSMIQMKEMLDVASTILLQTADPSYSGNKKITDLQKGQILDHKDGMAIEQINIQPINMQQFENAVTAWENHARVTGSANDAQLGENPASGTPFKLQDLVVQQGQGIHEFRKGKIAAFLGEVYRDWILNYLVKEMSKGYTWLEDLSVDELQWVAERVAINESNKKIIEIVLSGQMVTPQQQQTLIETIKADFKKGGTKRFMKIVKDELKTIPIDVEINIAGKQKDLSKITDKLVNIFRQIIANPQGFVQTMQIPGMAKTFNEILEFSGLSPADFSDMTKMMTQQPPPQQQNQPIKSPIQQQDLQTNQPTQ